MVSKYTSELIDTLKEVAEVRILAAMLLTRSNFIYRRPLNIWKATMGWGSY